MHMHGHLIHASGDSKRNANLANCLENSYCRSAHETVRVSEDDRKNFSGPEVRICYIKLGLPHLLLTYTKLP